MNDKIRSDGRVIGPDPFTNVLGVVYSHSKTSDGGDLYLTRFGQEVANFLEIENWYEKEWFEERRERLKGTGSVYKLPTKPVDGANLTLVVKNSRVGENVPLDTHTLITYINTEFNSPWEEFSLVMEMREGLFGPPSKRVETQKPLAIYVPPDRLQLWQTGRSKSKMNKIAARHPGIYLDILRQYKLIYRWIEGKNVVELFEEAGFHGERLEAILAPITKKVIADMEEKGYAVADMKPVHIIIGDDILSSLKADKRTSGVFGGDRNDEFIDEIQGAVMAGRYSVVDYELLFRTPVHEQEVKISRRHSYLDHQLLRFQEAPLPDHLKAMEIFGVPYIFGHAESTGGSLWVVGKDPNLFDFFLPERWRQTPSKRLSAENEVYYTLTKDNVHIVWKTSKVGERPSTLFVSEGCTAMAFHAGYNSPFEEFAIAQYLHNHDVPAVYVRALYMTGTSKLEQSSDSTRFETHKDLLTPEGEPVLRLDRNYITIRGYYNGTDRWVAEHDASYYQPADLIQAIASKIISKEEFLSIFDYVRDKLNRVGYDGSLLSGNDIIIATDPNGNLVRNAEGMPQALISNFELLKKIPTFPNRDKIGGSATP
jgi:hypothetical protein